MVISSLVFSSTISFEFVENKNIVIIISLIMRQRIHIPGVISNILNSDKAVISFKRKGKEQSALMQKNVFYHDGRAIPINESWDDYIAIGMLVKFNLVKQFSVEYSNFEWWASICWPIKSDLFKEVSMNTSFVNTLGQVIDIKDRHGILEIRIFTGPPYKVLFDANNVYLDGKKFTGKHLDEVLNIREDVLVDAIPCFPKENNTSCQWFATMVYKGQKPQSPWANYTNNDGTSSLNEGLNIFWESVYNSSTLTSDIKNNQLRSLNNDFRIQCLNLIQQHINYRETLFISGKGIILDIVNDEFGILLGELRKNLFQTIIFHRQNVFLHQEPLKSSNLLEILHSGNRVNFIAVAAPLTFLTSWIGVQVSVLDDK